MKHFEIRWKDRAGFPGGVAEYFDASNNADAIKQFLGKVPALQNRNTNQRLGHCALALHSPNGTRLKLINWGM